MTSRAILSLCTALLLSAAMHAPRAFAQDPPRFQPPRPPPLDQDFEDPVDEELENGDSPSRPQFVPPANNTQAPPPPPPANDYHPPAQSVDSGKVKFKVVDGEYYEKGKKRGRAPVGKRTQ